MVRFNVVLLSSRVLNHQLLQLLLPQLQLLLLRVLMMMTSLHVVTNLMWKNSLRVVTNVFRLDPEMFPMMMMAMMLMVM